MLLCDQCQREITHRERARAFTNVVFDPIPRDGATELHVLSPRAVFGDVCSRECHEAWRAAQRAATTIT